MLRILLLLAALPILASTSASGQALSPRERRLVTLVDQGVPAALALLERAVNQNSGSLNLAGVRETGRIFAPAFERLGFTVRWVDGAAWGRAGHLVAERHGGRGPKLLLIGHLDTVFEPDSPFQRWERLSDSTARGPGTTDMKGGNVVMLLALEALRDAGLLDGMQVTAILIGDEESSGEPLAAARRDLVEAARWADIAIGFEDGDGDPGTAVIGRRGYTSWTLRVTGTPAHSSQIFRSDIGDGAVFEAARILNQMRDSLAGEANLTFNPGLIAGGTTVTLEDDGSRAEAAGKGNVIAQTVVVSGDLRTLTPEQRERAKARMQAIVSRHLPGTSATISFEDGYPPMAPVEGNRRLLARFDQASRDLGAGPVTAVDPARAGAADISFTAGLVEMALDGVGLMGSGGHTVNETADLRTLSLNAKRVAVPLARLAAGQPRP